MTINKKLGIAFALMSLTLLICGGVGLYGSRMLSDALEFVSGQAWDAADGSMEGVISLQEQIIAIQRMSQPGADLGHLNQTIKHGEQMADESLQRMLATGLFSEQLAAGLTQRKQRFEQAKRELIDLYNRGGEDAELAQRFDSEVEKLLAFIGEMEEVGDSKVENEAGNIVATKSAAYTMIVVMMVVGLLVAIAAYLLSQRFIVRPINRTAAVLRDIADGEGDLTVRLDDRGGDETADVARAFNRFVDKLRGLIQEMQNSSSQIGSAMDTLSTVTEQTRLGTGRQLAETDQVATAMNEMAATVQEIAHHASDAAGAADTANQHAQAGTRVVNDTMAAISRLAGEVDGAAVIINELEAGSEEIGSVLDVIKGIAEQTNLLALNAAIEAARAGEQGRGFAVVADEVRNLASRTQESTEEIQQMIDKLQTSARSAVQAMDQGSKQAGDSVEQAGKAGEALAQISSSVEAINGLNTQIATASEEQSAVAEEINRNITAINQIAHETEAGAQQTSAQSENLQQLASTLQDISKQFKA